MARDKLITGIFGWWGIPFGIIYTLGVLLESNEGEIPIDPNADYLAALGLNFLARNQNGYAREAFEASLALRYDTKLEAAYNEIFGRWAGEFSGSRNQSGTDTVRSDSWNASSNNGWKWVLYGIFAVCALIVGGGLLGLLFGGDRNSTTVPQNMAQPTQNVASATVKRIASPSPAPTKAAWRQEIESQDGFVLDRPADLMRTRETLEDGRISITYAALVGEPFHYINVTSWDEVDLGSSADEYIELQRLFDDWLAGLENTTTVRHPQLVTLKQQNILNWVIDYALTGSQPQRIYSYLVPAEGKSFIVEIAGSPEIDGELRAIQNRVILSFELL